MVALLPDFILTLFVSAIWSIQIVESVLALRVKKYLYLSQPYPKVLLTLMRLDTWRRLVGTAFFLLMPLFLFAVLAIRLHHFISEILECKYCLSCYITFALLYCWLNFSVLEALLFAPTAIPFIYIIDRLSNYND